MRQQIVSGSFHRVGRRARQADDTLHFGKSGTMSARDDLVYCECARDFTCRLGDVLRKVLMLV